MLLDKIVNNNMINKFLIKNNKQEKKVVNLTKYTQYKTPIKQKNILTQAEKDLVTIEKKIQDHIEKRSK